MHIHSNPSCCGPLYPASFSSDNADDDMTDVQLRIEDEDVVEIELVLTHAPVHSLYRPLLPAQSFFSFSFTVHVPLFILVVILCGKILTIGKLVAKASEIHHNTSTHGTESHKKSNLPTESTSRFLDKKMKRRELNEYSMGEFRR